MEIFHKRSDHFKARGDSISATKILADTNKLIGNSAYGVVLMRRGKHRRLKYLNNSCTWSTEFNKSSFSRFEMIDKDLFESSIQNCPQSSSTNSCRMHVWVRLFSLLTRQSKCSHHVSLCGKRGTL